MFEFSKKHIKALLKGIYNGSINEYDLPENLYLSIANYLKKGLYKGFGGTLEDFTGKDLELLTELRENIYMFSAAKTYQQILDIRGLLIDENENIRTAKEFNELGRQRFDLWNDTWGETEHTTAIAQAQSASKWNEIEKNKDVLPKLRYSAVIDANTSDICEPLDGMVVPVDDPFWDQFMPPNHFNCRCTVLQEEENIPETNNDQVEEISKEVGNEMSDIFKMNPGKDGYIFKDDHPYFEVAKKDREFAKENFGLPIPEND